MFKNTVVLMVVVVIAISVCGCQTGKAICDDVAGTAAWASKQITPLVDKAKDRDAKIHADRLARYHAEQAGRFASYESQEVK